MNEYQNPAPRPNGQAAYRSGHAMPAPKSAMAIAGLVLGILALVTSVIPFVNNLSFFIAALGIIFAVIGLVATVRGTKSGKALAIAGLILGIVSIVAVLATQSMYSAAIDKAVSGPEAVSTSTTQSEQPATKEDTSAMAVGTAVDLDNGLSVTVTSVQAGLANYDGSAITGISVTYTNNGSSEASFNVFDWKGQDEQGAQRSMTYYSEGADELNSGTLAPGGSVSGNVYFEGNLVKALYFPSVLSDSSDIAWVLA